MGVTESGAVWLDPSLTSPYRFYQFWVNTPDEIVIQHVKFFTLLNPQDIETLEHASKFHPESREAQVRLAQEVTRMVHGDSATAKAELASRVLFGGGIAGLGADDVLEACQGIPSTPMDKQQFSGAGLPLLDLVFTCGLTDSKSESRRLIEGGGIYLNNRQISNVNHLWKRASRAGCFCCAKGRNNTTSSPCGNKPRKNRNFCRAISAFGLSICVR